MKYNKMHRNNNGISLVELLVVVAILSIAIGVTGIAVSFAGSKNTERCAKLVDDALESTRMNSLAREGVCALELDTTANTITSLVLDTVTGTMVPEGDAVLLPQRVTLTLESVGAFDLAASDVLRIQFDKSTGRVARIEADGGTVSVNLVRIHSEDASGKRVTVVLVTATGKHMIEYGN